MKACNQSAQIADIVFDMADKNDDGKIQIKEMQKYTDNFWFDLKAPIVKEVDQSATK